MAVFLSIYLYRPDDDSNKTTLKNGNPFRSDHFILGFAATQASLYKSPNQLSINYEWVWNVPNYDHELPHQSEPEIIRQLYHVIKQEMDRVQADRQVRFTNHYLVGYDLMSQLGCSYQRALSYQVARPELLYYVFLQSTIIDLGTIATSHQNNRKTLKPTYLPEFTRKHDLGTLSSQTEMMNAYSQMKYETIEQQAQTDIKTLLDTYHHLLLS